MDVFLSTHNKMNEIVKNSLLAGDKRMLEMHLKQTEFTYSASRLSAKNKEKIQKFKETRDSKYIYKNEPNKVYFPSFFLARTAASDKILRDKAFNIATNPKDGCQRGFLFLCFINFLIKKHQVVVLQVKLNKMNLAIEQFGVLIYLICN